MVISTDAFIRIFFLLLYVSVGVISYRLLLPRLSLTSKRLAIGMLLAQFFVIVVSLEIRPTSDFDRWLWDLSKEWNIPATLASTQLAVVAGVALLAGWLDRTRPAWRRIYLIAIGLVFLFLAWDEFTRIHETIQNWGRYYAAFGAIVVVATGIVALRSPRRGWLWHLCLVTGLAMAAFGAVVLDQFLNQQFCGVGIFQLSRCVGDTPFEEPLEFAGIWLALLAMLGHFSDSAPQLKPKVQRILYGLPPLWILVVFLNHPIHSLKIPDWARPASVQFESGTQIYGYKVDDVVLHSSAVIHLLGGAIASETGYSIHLIDQVSGDSTASRNEYLNRKDKVSDLSHDYRPIYRQTVELGIPRQAPANRALWIVLTLWREREGEFVRQKVLSSDHRLLDETQVVLGELVLPADSTASSTAPLAEFDKGFILEAMELPDRARAGETLSIPFAWRSDVDGQEDHVQFLHLGHEETGDWWVYDQLPLGDRLPTRLWYSGLADSEVWQAPLPADLAPGRYEVFTGLYRTRDQERIPASDADGERWLDGRVSLGMIVIG